MDASLEQSQNAQAGGVIPELPKEWIEVLLSEIVADVSYGYTASSSQEEVGPHLLRITDIQSNRVDWSHVPFCRIEKEKIDHYSLKAGDLVFARTGATVGKSYLIKDDVPNSVFASYLIRVRSVMDSGNEYLAHFFNSPYYWNQVTEFSAGIGQPNVNGTKLKALKVVLPPLAEQKIIAAKLDELLAQVDTLKTRLDTIPKILKRFRQSVLSAAVNGRLTEGWREINNPLEWRRITLQDVATIIDPHPSHRTPKAVANGTPYIGIGDLKPDGTIDFENARKVSPDVLVEHKMRYHIKQGDFVFGKIGTLGRATSLPVDINYTLSANVILIQPNSIQVRSEFLMYFLSATDTMEKIAQQASSTSQAAFGIKKMRVFQCEIPALTEQAEIVRRVEQLFTYADQIEQQVKNAQARVNHLTQSLLAKAFRGELTAEWRAQNPELISGENSAEALLARIKTEREASGQVKKSRKRKK